MPFSGIKPGSKLERDIDDCVASIRSDNSGMGKSQAIAICRSQLEKKMSKQEKTVAIDKSGGGKANIPDEGLNGNEGTEIFVAAKDKDMHRRPTREREHEKDGDGMIENFSVTMGATSFAQLREAERAQEAAREVRKLANQVPELVEGIFQDSTIEDKDAAIADLGPEFSAFVLEEMAETKERWQPITDAVANAISPLIDKQKPTKTDGGIKRSAEDFAFVPDSEKPSTWKLPLTDATGKVTRDKLGAAAAAFSPGGFRGQKVKIPSSDVAAVKAKIRSAYHKIGVKDDDIPASVRKELQAKNSFTVWKEKTGRYRWLAIYSNKFRDRDIPPEIISEASHLRFTKMVNSGEFPYPELWLWHVDRSRWGEADFVGYDDKGFMAATGLVDRGKEWVAKSLVDSRIELLASHGMPKGSIKRDPLDPTIYIEHMTKEISPLPADEAANKLTGFSILGDEVKSMAFSKEDQERLLKLNVDPDRLEAEAEDKAKEAERLELQHKDKEKEKAATETGEFVSRDEVTDLVKSVAESTNRLVQVVGDLAERLKALEANKLTIDKETLEHTPAASLADLYKSVVGSEETKVDGRSKLARSGPEEAPVEDAAIGSRFGGGLASVIVKRNQEIERGVQ